MMRTLAFVFQDPLAALNPRADVGSIVEQPRRAHRIGSALERRRRAADLLEGVGLGSGLYTRLPHELSGGQRQRVGIARALALNPDVIVCDEPVSALDVSVQAQVLNLLRELQLESGIAYLFISHDQAVIDLVSDRVLLMRDGRLEPRE